MSSMKLRAAALLSIAALSLTACGSTTDTAAEAKAGDAKTVTITDNEGEKTITVPAKSVVATDNRTFETLDSWGIELTAGAVSLMPDTISYTKDEKILDLGSHKEPNLESVVTVDPDLIINGQRYTQHAEKFKELAPEATIVSHAKASHSTPSWNARSPPWAKSSASRPRPRSSLRISRPPRSA